MKMITDKKELINTIGDWPTVQIRTNYKLGSNQIELKYDDKHIVYKNDDAKHVAYIALQCHAITNVQYNSLWL